MYEQNNVLISIIVPVYGVEEYLADCIDSILAQTITDFELLLVDDGSPDDCGRICDEYARKDARIKVIHQENKGQAAARNVALDMAHGAFITFIDSDDIVNSLYLEMLLDAMQPDVDVTVCKFLHFNNNTELALHSNNGTPNYKYYDSESIAIAIFDGQISAGPCGKLYRLDIIGQNRFPEGRIHEDVVFTPIVCYEARKTAVLGAKLYWYRRHSNSTTYGKFTTKRYDCIWATDQCIRYFEDKGELDIVKAARRKREYDLLTYVILARRDKVTVPKEYRVSLLRAVLSLRRLTSDEYYEYYLAQIHPKLALLHEYYRKIKQILHLV